MLIFNTNITIKMLLIPDPYKVINKNSKTPYQKFTYTSVIKARFVPVLFCPLRYTINNIILIIFSIACVSGFREADKTINRVIDYFYFY